MAVVPDKENLHQYQQGDTSSYQQALLSVKISLKTGLFKV